MGGIVLTFLAKMQGRNSIFSFAVIVFLLLPAAYTHEAKVMVPVSAPAPAPAPAPRKPEFFDMHGVTQGSLHPQECDGHCAYRCSKTQYKKPCLFFCNKCCATCLCVPPGTYGNKQYCPCYNQWKTKEGGPKCP